MQDEWVGGVGRWRVTYMGGYTASDTGLVVAALKGFLLDLCYQKYHARGGKSSEDGVSFDAICSSTGLKRQIKALSVKIPVG